MSDKVPSDETDDALETYLLGLSYIQSVINKDFDEALFLSHQVSNGELTRGLLATSLMMLMSLSTQLNLSKKEILVNMRTVVLASNS